MFARAFFLLARYKINDGSGLPKSGVGENAWDKVGIADIKCLLRMYLGRRGSWSGYFADAQAIAPRKIVKLEV